MRCSGVLQILAEKRELWNAATAGFHQARGSFTNVAVALYDHEACNLTIGRQNVHVTFALTSNLTNIELACYDHGIIGKNKQHLKERNAEQHTQQQHHT